MKILISVKKRKILTSIKKMKIVISVKKVTLNYQTRAGAGYLVSLGNQSEETQVFLANVVAIVITITILTDVTL